jgi:hypothetical protein
MALDWKSVKREHVEKACNEVAATATSKRTARIVLWHAQQPLPAKEVMRVAYRLANALPAGAELRFSSGDATINVLQRLGFQVERLPKARSGPPAKSTNST